MRLGVDNSHIEKDIGWHILRLLRLQDGLTKKEIVKRICDMYMECWEEDEHFIDMNIGYLLDKEYLKVTGDSVNITPAGLKALGEKDKLIEKRRESIFSKEATARNALWVNVVLSILKLSVGIISGSAGLIADGFHTGIDIFASVATWAGIKFNKEAHAGLIGGIIICIIALLILISAIATIFISWDVRLEYVAIIVIIITIIVNLLLTRYKFYVGGRTRSIALVADAYHSKTDIWSSLAALAGLFGAWLGFPVLDSVAGIVVSLVIMVGGIRIILEAKKLLGSDEEPDLEKFSSYIERHARSLLDMGVLYGLWLLKLHPMTKRELNRRLREGFLGKRFPIPLEDSDYEEIFGRLIDDNLIIKKSGKIHLTQDGEKRIDVLLKSSAKKVPWFERGTVIPRWVAWFAEGL